MSNEKTTPMSDEEIFNNKFGGKLDKKDVLTMEILELMSEARASERQSIINSVEGLPTDIEFSNKIIEMSKVIEDSSLVPEMAKWFREKFAVALASQESRHKSEIAELKKLPQTVFDYDKNLAHECSSLKKQIEEAESKHLNEMEALAEWCGENLWLYNPHQDLYEQNNHLGDLIDECEFDELLAKFQKETKPKTDNA